MTGTYQWDASFSGDTNNTPASENNAAAEQVVVSPASPTITTTPSVTSLTLGVSSVTLKDTAVLSRGYYETGTITFTLYLGSTKVDTETVPVSGNGNYTTPAGYTLPATGTVTGTYQWDASYSGGTNNASASEINAVAERVTVSPASPTITTTPSPTIVPMGTAASLTDTATLAGGWDPTGTITFTLYQGSTKLETETVTVRGNGSYTTPSSYSLSSCVPSGVYQWDASYSGDANNNVASDNNDPAEQVTVVSPCCNLQDIPYSVYNPATMTTTTPADLSGNTAARRYCHGDLYRAGRQTTTRSRWSATRHRSRSTTPTMQTFRRSSSRLRRSRRRALIRSADHLAPNFYQVDFVCGTVITTLGPEATNPNNFYHAQNRYIDGDNGGVNPAGSGVLSVTGEVYNDVNVDGKLDSGDQGLAQCDGHTESAPIVYGNSISETTTTNGSGVYSFSGLPFSNSAGYAVSVSPPSGYSSGAATVGTVNGVADGTATTSPEGVEGIVLG